MAYLVDGHNLIPHVHGLSLQELEDELRLIELLQVFCRVRRQVVEVFYDQAPPGKAGPRRYGQVTARFVRQGRTADEAIVARLDQLGKSARNWVVVSSDRRVQGEARIRQVGILSSGEFAHLLQEALTESNGERSPSAPVMSKAELDEWLETFGDE